MLTWVANASYAPDMLLTLPLAPISLGSCLHDRIVAARSNSVTTPNSSRTNFVVTDRTGGHLVSWVRPFQIEKFPRIEAWGPTEPSAGRPAQVKSAQYSYKNARELIVLVVATLPGLPPHLPRRENSI